MIAVSRAVDISEPGVYTEQLHLAHTIAHWLMAMPLGEMLAAINRTETIAPMIDPTMWILNGEKMAQDKEVISALNTARQAIMRGIGRANGLEHLSQEELEDVIQNWYADDAKRKELTGR